jgi:NADH dehydrogenase/NADH:ubiquinone oxidoreductase subunit G
LEIQKLHGTLGFKIDWKTLQTFDKKFDSIRKQVKSLQRDLDSIRITKLTSGIAGSTANSNKLANNLTKLNNAASSGVQHINAYAAAISHLQRSLAGLSSVSGSMQRLPRAPSVSAGGGSSYGRRTSTGAATGGFIGGLIGGPGAFARGLLPGLGAGWAVRESVIAGRQSVSQELAFQALAGGPAGGKAETDWAKNLANTLGISQVNVLDQYKGLYAATRHNEKLKGQTRNIFQGFTEYGTALGLDPERMKGGIIALQQMASKGKIMSEELYGQMSEHLP